MLRNLIAALVLFCGSLSASPVTVDSLEELLPYLRNDNVRVKLAPGTYEISGKSISEGKFANPLLTFSGNHSNYDFTDVTLSIKTEVLQAFGKVDVHQIRITGMHNTLTGLTMVDEGKTTDAPAKRATNIVIDGSDNLVENFLLTIRGSFPYGYGDLFGKGGNSTIRHRKHSGILIRGDKIHLKGTTLIHRAYGHGIFAQGARDVLIEDCHVKGETRSTDDILLEKGTGSPADKVDFRTMFGYPVPPGYTISLQEAGIRSYGKSNTPDGVRETVGITVRDCTIDKMRSGIVLTHNKGKRLVSGCKTTNCEKGYSIGRGIIENCSSDVRYGPAYRSDYSSDTKVKADITILPGNGGQNGSGLVAFIAGDKDIEITLHGNATADRNLKIQVGGRVKTKAHLKDSNSSQNNLTANGVILNNTTGFPVSLAPGSTNCKISSTGKTRDLGTGNRVSSP